MVVRKEEEKNPKSKRTKEHTIVIVLQLNTHSTETPPKDGMLERICMEEQLDHSVAVRRGRKIIKPSTAVLL